MKIRILKKPEFEYLHFVQVKYWFLPFWVEVFTGILPDCEKYFDYVIKSGKTKIILREGEV